MPVGDQAAARGQVIPASTFGHHDFRWRPTNRAMLGLVNLAWTTRL